LTDNILWLQLPERNKAIDGTLYSSINDFSDWTKRTCQLSFEEQIELYRCLLNEVNQVDLAINKRLVLLACLDDPIHSLLNALQKKYAGLGIPLAKENLGSVKQLTECLGQLITAYKIIIAECAQAGILIINYIPKVMILFGLIYTRPIVLLWEGMYQTKVSLHIVQHIPSFLQVLLPGLLRSNIKKLYYFL